MKRSRPALVALLLGALASEAPAASAPIRARNAMVSSQNAIASQIGLETLLAGGNAVDAAVATAFALAVVHPEAGNIGGGGFLLAWVNGTSAVYDFREQAPAAASATMFLKDGQYDRARHHQGALAVGVPGTVAGLAQVWQDGGRLPWKLLLRPAITLAREGFMVSDGLARSLKGELARMQAYPASLAQFSRQGVPYEMGDVLKQEDLAKTLTRIAESGSAGFYEGETAALIEREMKARGGLITREDLKRYTVYRRPALRGTYRDYEVLTVPPPSSGGTCLVESLNVLEGYDLKAMGFGSSRYLHHVAETLRRAFADRARYLGDPAFAKDMPVERLVSKDHAASLRQTIRREQGLGLLTRVLRVAGREQRHHAPVGGGHRGRGRGAHLHARGRLRLADRGARSRFPAQQRDGRLQRGARAHRRDGPDRHRAQPRRPRQAHALEHDPDDPGQGQARGARGGSAGGRKIPGTVLQIVLGVVDFDMNVQEAIDAPRISHQWLPDVILHEPFGLSSDTAEALRALGHRVEERPAGEWSRAHGIAYRDGMLEGGSDRRKPDGAAIGR
jgi:gamma-glutamyltranspeptidase/glutathione hydrolase